MKIAMFTNNYKPYVAGVPVSIEHLAEALRKIGHTVYIFAPSYENQTEEEYVIRYPSFPVKIAGAPIPNVLTKLFERKVQELEIDVIHVHHPALVGNIALGLQKKYGIPVVFTYHTRYEAYLHYVKPLQWLEEASGLLERYLDYFAQRCDLIIAPTPGMKKYLETRDFNTPIGVLPTGVTENNFYPDEKQAEEIRKQYLKNADYLFLTVSRLAKEKNLDFQMEGLAILKEHLKKRGKSFVHMIIGDGPQKEHLMERARELGLEENVVFMGNMENQEIPAYQKAADAFLFSSKSETQGIVLLEAMAAGTPVIAVKASGVEDIVEDGKNGFLTEENPGVWAERILIFTERKELQNEMQKAAEKTARFYAEEEIARRAGDFYFLAENATAKSLPSFEMQNTHCFRGWLRRRSAEKVPFFKRYVV